MSHCPSVQHARDSRRSLNSGRWPDLSRFLAVHFRTSIFLTLVFTAITCPGLSHVPLSHAHQQWTVAGGQFNVQGSRFNVQSVQLNTLSRLNADKYWTVQCSMFNSHFRSNMFVRVRKTGRISVLFRVFSGSNLLTTEGTERHGQKQWRAMTAESKSRTATINERPSIQFSKNSGIH